MNRHSMSSVALSTEKVAWLLDLSPRTIARWCREAQFPTAHKVGRVWRINSRDEVLRAMVREVE